MTMTRLLLIIISFWGLVSCNTETDNSPATNLPSSSTHKQKINLSGQVYFYAPELDTTTCNATGACDCCSGNIIFLNDSIFLSIDMCESNTSYTKGIYRFDNDFLVLTSDSLQVDKEYNWAKEMDTTGTITIEYYINQRKNAPFTQKLTLFDCKGNFYFTLGSKEKYFVTLDKNTKISDLIIQLKKDSIWDKLEINNF